MTHEPETRIDRDVTDWLIEHYGRDNVESKAFQPSTYRYPDVLVEGPVVDLAIEIENDADAVIPGTGQAMLYYATELATGTLNSVPVVISPHVPQPEAMILNAHTCVTVLEWPLDFPGAGD